jgi:hypothetical protein
VVVRSRAPPTAGFGKACGESGRPGGFDLEENARGSLERTAEGDQPACLREHARAAASWTSVTAPPYPRGAGGRAERSESGGRVASLGDNSTLECGFASAIFHAEAGPPRVSSQWEPWVRTWQPSGPPLSKVGASPPLVGVRLVSIIISRARVGTPEGKALGGASPLLLDRGRRHAGLAEAAGSRVGGARIWRL